MYSILIIYYNKCIIIVLIIFLVFILINENSCENYTGIDIQENSVPCYEAIKYKNLEESRKYNPDNVNYDEPEHEEGYDFSWNFKDFKDEEELKLNHSEEIFNIYACPHHFKIKKGHLSDSDISNLEYICAIASGGYYYIKTEYYSLIDNCPN
jgi:hypothetical protein